MTCPPPIAATAALVLLAISTTAQAATGRTAGSAAVSRTGAFSYQIPIWTPPGPRRVQPNVAVGYDSAIGEDRPFAGTSNPDLVSLGPGWVLSGLSSIQRCARTVAQDGAASAVMFTTSDAYCLNGNRLRLTSGSGTYGLDGSTYQTELADFSLVTAHGPTGYGPTYFTVEGKDGLTYEFGSTTDARVLLPNYSAVRVWLLNKVSDRAGNNYVVTYGLGQPASAGVGVPLTISWTPSGSGSTSYRYTVSFTYSLRASAERITSYVFGQKIVNANLLSAITVSRGDTVARHYRFEYDTSPTTQRSRLQSLQECADTAMTECLAPTIMAYVQGAPGVSGAAQTALNSSTSLAGAYDFNGDGRSDLLYDSGGTLHIAFSTGSGFGSGVSTGLTIASSDRYYAANLVRNGGADILITRGGVWWRYYWNGSAFTGASTDIPAPDFSGDGPSFMELADQDGDGLSDLVMMTTTRSGSPESYYYSGTIRIRRNTSSGGTFSFSTTEATYSMPGCSMGVGCVPFVMSARPWSQSRDLNADGRSDLLVGVTDIGFNMQTTNYYALISNGATYTTVSGYAYLNSIGYLKWNDDRCADVVTSAANGSGTIAIAACDGSVAQSLPFSGEVVGVTDWNGDGRSDLLVRNGTTLGIYTSTSDGVSSLIATTIPLGAGDTVVPLEVDGDGLLDIIVRSGTAPYAASYRLHNDIGAMPDHLNSVTDGYGVTTSIAYGSITAGHYTKGTGAADLEEEWIGPFWVVKTFTTSNGIGGNYTQTFWYTGARKHRHRGFEGFEMRQITDSRTGHVRKTYYDLLFPKTGMVKKDELFQADGTTVISRSEYENTPQTLDGTAANERYFPYASSVTTDTREVDGAKNGQPITSRQIEFGTPDSYGNFDSIIETLTDKDTDSPFANQAWTTTATTTYLPNPGNWCVGQPTGMTVARTAPGQPTITRTVSYGVDYSNCRRESEVTEPGNSTYELTRTFGFDAFGNVDSETVTGAGITSRTTTIDWGTTGQFPETITDPVGSTAGYRVRRGYDYTKGVLSSEVVQASDGATNNAPETSWQYDSFARPMKQTRPDQTATSWSYSDCAPSCFNGNHQLTVTQSALDVNGVTIADQITYLDQFERPLITRQRMLDGAHSQTERQYDSLGRVFRQSMPCSAGGCTVYWITPTYDGLGRPTAVSRPIKESNVALQSTTIDYLGGKTVVTDAEGKTTTKIVDVAGNLRRSQDHTGYYQSFTYDSFGSLTDVADSASRTLFSATYDYGIGAFQRTRSDRSLGAGTATYSALGELIAYTDAKNQNFAMAYDALSRPLTRRDGVTSPTTQETQTTWNWGQSPALHNIGQLESVSVQSADGAYMEAYTYDSKGRLANHAITIPSDATHQYDFAYDDAATGLLETLTYPTSTLSQRFALRYCYQYGYLQKVADGSCSGTAFWQANAMTARAQITNETLGNGVITQRTFDAVTGWVSNVTSGAGGNPTSVQNESYLFDRVGNVTQRQNNALGLTENFYYDDLYRIDYSMLNNSTGTSTNLDLSYDALGYIETKVETGTTSPPIGQDIDWTSYNYPRQIRASVAAPNDQIASFAYGPDRQRWRMIYTSGSTAETTHYIGGLMEKVTIGSATDYRHYIYAGGQLAAIYSRHSSGTNTLRYVLEDHQGSVAGLVNSSGVAIVNESFTAYGNRRDATTWSGAAISSELATMDDITRRGYTGHAALGTMGLNHMNGRVQDAITGTFLSPDPFITQPGNTQNFNRYAYVHNNPITFIDPSGFSTTSIDCVLENFSLLNYGGPRTADNTEILTEGAAPSSPCLWIPPIIRPPSVGGGGEPQPSTVDGTQILNTITAPWGGWSDFKDSVRCTWECDWPGDGSLEANLAAVPFIPAVGVEAATARLGSKLYDIIPYWRTAAAGFQKHHGVLDAWARANILGYKSGAAPAVVLSIEQHNATRAIFNTWRAEQGWARTPIDWSRVSPQQIQALTYRMFEAAGVPKDVVSNYFRAFDEFLYGF